MDIRTFFGTNQPSANTSIAFRQLLDVQRRTHSLYNNVVNLNQEQIERAIDGIVGSAREMTRMIQEENTVTNTGNQGIQILQRLHAIRDRVQAQAAQGPPPMRTEPQIVPVRPQAELRPAARAPFTQEQNVRILVERQPPRAPRAPRAPREAIPVDWNVPKRSSRMKKLKVVPQAEINDEVECEVCFDSHKKDKILTTDCAHKYCITCWSNWMRSSQSNKTCPTCRTVCPPVTYYKVKAATRRRATQQNEIA